MTTTIDQHGQKVTVIGTITDGRGGRQEVTVTEFKSGGVSKFSLRAGSGGHADAGRFSTQVKRAKSRFSDPSNQAEWFC